MNLSVSNIAWPAAQDAEVYQAMQDDGFIGLEIAPTRLFPVDPYARIREAAVWSRNLKDSYGFVISSMQSIWYSRHERIFGSNEEREVLTDYTRNAIDFAAAVGCKNLVFGCPRNRNIPDGMSPDAAMTIAVDFFHTLGEYASVHNTVIGMEANPPIYHTNFINTTSDALTLIREVGSDGFKLNLDMGTMIENKEDLSILSGNTDLINHVHISEPYLKPIQERGIHRGLVQLLRSGGYDRFISLEMGKTDDLQNLIKSMAYLKTVVS